MCYNVGMEKTKANQLSPLVLAFLGDAEYTLFVRRMLVESHDLKSGGLHKMTSRYVCARAQAIALDELMDRFTDEEKEIGKRCRNAHNTSKAKNAGLADYKKASGYEAVLGYLYLTGQTDRLYQLLNIGEKK